MDADLEGEFETRVAESSVLAFRVAYSVLRNREEAEDVAQNALIKAYRHFRSLRGRDRFRAWLVRIAWRHALEIKPSADFNAQLYERLAVERRARVWLRWPMLAMAAGAAAAIVLAVVLLRSPAREARTASAPPAPIATPSPAPRGPAAAQ